MMLVIVKTAAGDVIGEFEGQSLEAWDYEMNRRMIELVEPALLATILNERGTTTGYQLSALFGLLTTENCHTLDCISEAYEISDENVKRAYGEFIKRAKAHRAGLVIV